jgi:ParB family chromosome partitioning protein
MPELLSTITSLSLSDISIPTDRLRPVSEAGVQALLHVIAGFGFTTPVVIRRKRSGFVLIDGAHRVEAMKRSGMSEIPVRVYTCTDDEARAMEAGQNIAGADLSPLDDALFLAAYSAAYEELHPETRGGVAGGLARQGLATELSSFADVMAEKRSITTRQVRKIVAAGRLISRSEAEQLRAAKRKVTLKDIEEIGKIGEPEERAMVVLRLSVGNAKSAAEARRSLRAENGDPKITLKDPIEEAFKALSTIWARAHKSAKRRFVEERAVELAAFLDEMDFAAELEADEVSF